MSSRAPDAAVDLADLPPGGRLAVQVADHNLALFHLDGRIYAIDNECPHQGAPLIDGFLDGYELTCPLHAWTFDVRNGHWCGTQSHPLRCHDVAIVGDRIEIRIHGGD